VRVGGRGGRGRLALGWGRLARPRLTARPPARRYAQVSPMLGHVRGALQMGAHMGVAGFPGTAQWLRANVCRESCSTALVELVGGLPPCLHLPAPLTNAPACHPARLPPRPHLDLRAPPHLLPAPPWEPAADRVPPWPPAAAAAVAGRA
jgi:hypothetical protein